MQASTAVKMPSTPRFPITTTEPYFCWPMISTTSSIGASPVTMEWALDHRVLDVRVIRRRIRERFDQVEIALADDAAQVAIRVEDRQVPDRVLAHQAVSLGEGCASLDRHGLRRHVARDRWHQHAIRWCIGRAKPAARAPPRIASGRRPFAQNLQMRRESAALQSLARFRMRNATRRFFAQAASLCRRSTGCVSP